jgi:flagellar biosynthesis/type III secretory pathway ATPase
VLLPLDVAGIARRAVWRTGARCDPCGEELLGRVLDGIGAPLDEVRRSAARLGDRSPAPRLSRPAISVPPTGVRVLDTMLTLGRGQRVGCSRRRVGKSTLLGLSRAARASTSSSCA